ncbi:hypothetical protein BV25DRAFT_1294601 [Artomyces pyxidatus]|uniref:Uncharacterized protein n=1 Tax=Artomyces pyxidatus TaxID=48021 RepID=A0ACB8SNU9_9AGAM|nr:hypothetical protein BV25DRAFT_1294601 [Artomyces pyxidatus]
MVLSLYGQEVSLGAVVGTELFQEELSPLHPTLSVWLRNMARLWDMIEHLRQLALSTPTEHRRPLLQQVTALRASVMKQQQHYISFTHLTEEYADRYLHDISDEIQSQSAFLQTLERRLQQAKSLRGEVVDLIKSFEKETCGNLKSVRAAARAVPLPDDTPVFEALDGFLCGIRACYKDLDRFWIGEVRRVSKALKTCRVERDEVDRWKDIQLGLRTALNFSKDNPPDPVVQPNRRKPGGRDVMDDLGSIAVDLVPVMYAADSKLDAVRLSATAALLKPARVISVHQAKFGLQRNEQGCLGFMQDCVGYGTKVVAICTSFLLRPLFARTWDSQDLRSRARAIVDAEEKTVLSLVASEQHGAAGGKYDRNLRKIELLARQMETAWDEMLNRGRRHIFSLLIGTPDRECPDYSLERLVRSLRSWTKEKKALGELIKTVRPFIV